MFFSCNTDKSNKSESVLSSYDSIQLELDAFERELEVERRKEEIMFNLNWDTMGIDSCGLKIVSAKFIKEEYSSYKSVKLVYKNISGKKIKAIRFKWYGINAFGEPAEAGSIYNAGFGGGFDDNGLGVGKQTHGIWSVYSHNGDEITKAWPTEIVFEDGSKWKSSTK